MLVFVTTNSKFQPLHFLVSNYQLVIVNNYCSTGILAIFDLFREVYY